MLLPAVNYLAGGGGFESLVGIAGVGLAIAAQPGLAAASRAAIAAIPWLPFVSTGLRRQRGQPGAVAAGLPRARGRLNSVVAGAAIPLVVLATAPRNDVRVTLFAGVLAVCEFLVISFVFQYAAGGPIHSDDYGTVEMSSQLAARLVAGWRRRW
jgi:hypothetical protein